MHMSEIVMSLAALALVLALVWLAPLLLRGGGTLLGGALRRGAGAAEGRLALVQSLALDPRRRVHLLRCDGRCVLVMTGGGQDVVLGWLPEATEPRP